MTLCPRCYQPISSESADWIPDAAHINALPEPIRRYIHDLETRCDPAGDIRALTIARDTIKALEMKLAERGL
jgi:hypothetical protein